MTGEVPRQRIRSGLKSAEAGRVLNVSEHTVAEWERRAGIELCVRTQGGHRVWDHRVILAMRDAQNDGFTGADIVLRAAELIRSGRYTEPQPLRERMFALEKKMDTLITLVQALCSEVGKHEPAQSPPQGEVECHQQP